MNFPSPMSQLIIELGEIHRVARKATRGESGEGGFFSQNSLERKRITLDDKRMPPQEFLEFFYTIKNCETLAVQLAVRALRL